MLSDTFVYNYNISVRFMTMINMEEIKEVDRFLELMEKAFGASGILMGKRSLIW